MKTTHYISVALLNNVFKDIDSISAEELLAEYTRQYNDHKMLYTVKYNRAEKARKNMNHCKVTLRSLLEEGYFTMSKKDLECYPTQKLFDADEFPIGFKTRMLDL